MDLSLDSCSAVGSDPRVRHPKLTPLCQMGNQAQVHQKAFWKRLLLVPSSLATLKNLRMPCWVDEMDA